MNRNYSKIIVSTLLNMLKITPYDEISVATLCRTAGVSRQSFYYYFADLNDCLMSIIIAEGVNVRKNSSYNNIRELLMDLYNYIYANRVVFTNIATSSQAGVLYEKIQKLGKDILRSEITKWIPDVEYLSADDMDYILSFYFANFISSISLWMKKGFSTTPDYEIVHFILVTDGMVKEWVRRFIAFNKRKALPDHSVYSKYIGTANMNNNGEKL